ncbi:MAG TPA: hypothetical protein VFS32_07495 [Candidatus Limnocylindrales bacterium]|nr:hypothetical protein [Candidatus Limnocylindrales bacterium]
MTPHLFPTPRGVATIGRIAPDGQRALALGPDDGRVSAAEDPILTRASVAGQ